MEGWVVSQGDRILWGLGKTWSISEGGWNIMERAKIPWEKLDYLRE